MTKWRRKSVCTSFHHDKDVAIRGLGQDAPAVSSCNMGGNYTRNAARPLLVTWVMSLWSCVLAPPIEEGVAQENQPPRILTDALVPSALGGAFTMSTSSDVCQFSALVEEPDPDDTLYWRFFIDYSNDPAPLDTEVFVTEADPAQPLSARLLSFTVDPTDPRWGVAAGRLTEVHSVDLVVADRPFFNTAVPPVARRPQDEDGYTTSYAWPIELIDDPGITTCVTTGGF